MSDQNDYFKTITRVSRVFGSTMKRDEILNLIVRSAAETMEGKAAALFLLDENRGTYVLAASTGLSKGYVHSDISHIRKIMPELTGKGFIYYRDAATDPGSSDNNREHKKREGIVSLLVVPVMVRGEMIGTLALYTAEPREFTDREIAFLTVLAEHGGMAIETARLIQKLRDNNRIFIELAADINASLDLKDILQALTSNVAEALGVKAASIRLLDEQRKHLTLVASHGLSDTYLNKGPVSAEKSIAQALSGKSVVIKDASRNEGVQYREAKKKEGIVSILCVPIRAKDEVIGVLRLYSSILKDFTEDEIMHVTALASQGGLAIQNAVLYLMLQSDMKELKEETWRHRSWF
ncbi:MAG: GAF domain-containing protein [Syntrophales bacterium]|jgi:GAF domain-containing protein|nr:GAF domain-containing protein [Syntrophales bacterium]MCK9528530.1 GAF domain-containing protein [Syntrophales bacterium]MDX9922843.1 GAF domain-containing protein [Syntrophales bacterium]